MNIEKTISYLMAGFELKLQTLQEEKAKLIEDFEVQGNLLQSRDEEIKNLNNFLDSDEKCIHNQQKQIKELFEKIGAIKAENGTLKAEKELQEKKIKHFKESFEHVYMIKESYKKQIRNLKREMKNKS